MLSSKVYPLLPENRFFVDFLWLVPFVTFVFSYFNFWLELKVHFFSKLSQNFFQKIKLSRELSDIVIYTQSLKFSSFEDAHKNSKFYNIRYVVFSLTFFRDYILSHYDSYFANFRSDCLSLPVFKVWIEGQIRTWRHYCPFISIWFESNVRKNVLSKMA